jgi:hypothetical protein
MRRLTYEPTRDAETHSAFTRRRAVIAVQERNDRKVRLRRDYRSG